MHAQAAQVYLTLTSRTSLSYWLGDKCSPRISASLVGVWLVSPPEMCTSWLTSGWAGMQPAYSNAVMQSCSHAADVQQCSQCTTLQLTYSNVAGCILSSCIVTSNSRNSNAATTCKLQCATLAIQPLRAKYSMSRWQCSHDVQCS